MPTDTEPPNAEKAPRRKRRSRTERIHDLQQELAAQKRAERQQKNRWKKRAIDLIEKQLASGLSGEDFAQSIGISHRQLQRIVEKGNPEATAAFIGKALKNPKLQEEWRKAPEEAKKRRKGFDRRVPIKKRTRPPAD